MISSIEGLLADLGEGFAILKAGPFTYQVFIPSRLSRKLTGLIGQNLKLFTVHYLEGSLRGGNPVPRLVGFENEVEREFFERFITVPNVGVRRALRALTLPINKIADAIESEDVCSLKGMKGIGEKTAKKIIAELKGQMGKYALLPRGEVLETPVEGENGEIKEQGVRALVNLGYKSVEAEKMVSRAMSRGKFVELEELIKEVYRDHREQGRNIAPKDTNT
jgi:Holliday junction DNA helicase RuvA